MKAVLRVNRVNEAFEYVLKEWGGSLLLLFLRLHVGWVFFHSGMVKVASWPATLALFHDEYKVPLLPPDAAAYLGTFGELSFSALLFAGLLSRPAALGLFVVNAMAVISYPQLFEFDCPAAINQHFSWGTALLVLAAFGAGRISLDALLTRQR
jgi:putative oxidoreductase